MAPHANAFPLSDLWPDKLLRSHIKVTMSCVVTLSIKKTIVTRKKYFLKVKTNRTYLRA